MPTKEEWDSLKIWLNKFSESDAENKKKMLDNTNSGKQDTLRKQACADLESKLGNSRLIHHDGFSDGYGDLKSSYSKSDEIILYSDGRFVQHLVTTSGFGAAGSGFTEKKKTGRWTTWCHVSKELHLQGCSLSLIDEQEVYDNRPIKLENGSVLFGDKRYQWSRL